MSILISLGSVALLGTLAVFGVIRLLSDVLDDASAASPLMPGHDTELTDHPREGAEPCELRDR
jgi:hypothetical protein